MIGRLSAGRRLILWLRLVWPPAWVLVTIVACWLICEAVYLLVAWQLPGGLEVVQVHSPRDLLIILAAAVCGTIRAATTHPVANRDYYNWLLRTPWERGQPLPLGPVHLVWQDLLLVAGLTLLTLFQPAHSPLFVPLAFLLAYLLQLARLLWCTGEVWTCYGLTFWLGLVVKLAAWSPALALAAAIAAYAPAVAALWHSLAAFPWFKPLGWAMRFWEQQSAAFRGGPIDFGGRTTPVLPEIAQIWPLGQLHHRRVERLIEPREAIAMALLVGWWAGVLWSLLDFSADPKAANVGLMIAIIGGSVLSGGRLLRYTLGHASPLSPWGRICTLRWIIPEHDIVFVAPLLGFAISTTLPFALLLLGVPAPGILGATLTVVLLINLLFPPRLRKWQLTAPVRLSRPQLAKAANATVEEI